MRTAMVRAAGLAIVFATLLACSARAHELCPLLLRPLVVPAPRAERMVLFRRLNRTEAQPLTDAQAAEILGRSRAPEGAFVRRFLVETVRRLERVREEEERKATSEDGPIWMSTDEEELIALQELSASAQTSTLRPYLVNVVTNRIADEDPPTDRDFQIEDCGDSLLIDPLGAPGPKTIDRPLVVFLSRSPKRVEVVGGGTR